MTEEYGTFCWYQLVKFDVELGNPFEWTFKCNDDCDGCVNWELFFGLSLIAVAANDQILGFELTFESHLS